MIPIPHFVIATEVANNTNGQTTPPSPEYAFANSNTTYLAACAVGGRRNLPTWFCIPGLLTERNLSNSNTAHSKPIRAIFGFALVSTSSMAIGQSQKLSVTRRTIRCAWYLFDNLQIIKRSKPCRPDIYSQRESYSLNLIPPHTNKIYNQRVCRRASTFSYSVGLVIFIPFFNAATYSR